MKLFIFIFGIFLFTSCEEPKRIVGKIDGVEYYDWSSYYDVKLSKLKPPVILIGKDKTFDHWGVTLKDANGEILTIGNLVSTANNIGASNEVGDVIK
jgi:hypothetical protein